MRVRSVYLYTELLAIQRHRMIERMIEKKDGKEKESDYPFDGDHELKLWLDLKNTRDTRLETQWTLENDKPHHLVVECLVDQLKYSDTREKEISLEFENEWKPQKEWDKKHSIHWGLSDI